MRFNEDKLEELGLGVPLWWLRRRPGQAKEEGPRYPAILGNKKKRYKMVTKNTVQPPFKHTQEKNRIQLCHRNSLSQTTNSIHSDHYSRNRHLLSTRSMPPTDRDKKVAASKLPTVTWEERVRWGCLWRSSNRPRNKDGHRHTTRHAMGLTGNQQALSLAMCTILTAYTNEPWKFCKVHMGKEWKNF